WQFLQCRRGAAGRKDNGGSFYVGFFAECRLDSYLSCPRQPCCAIKESYLVLFEEIRNSVRESFDDAALAVHHHLQIKTEVACPNAVLFEARTGQRIKLAGVEKRLAGNAADIQAG